MHDRSWETELQEVLSRGAGLQALKWNVTLKGTARRSVPVRRQASADIYADIEGGAPSTQVELEVCHTKGHGTTSVPVRRKASADI